MFKARTNPFPNYQTVSDLTAIEQLFPKFTSYGVRETKFEQTMSKLETIQLFKIIGVKIKASIV